MKPILDESLSLKLSWILHYYALLNDDQHCILTWIEFELNWNVYLNELNSYFKIEFNYWIKIQILENILKFFLWIFGIKKDKLKNTPFYLG